MRILRRFISDLLKNGLLELWVGPAGLVFFFLCLTALDGVDRLTFRLIPYRSIYVLAIVYFLFGVLLLREKSNWEASRLCVNLYVVVHLLFVAALFLLSCFIR
jgi:hypothetical protein